MLVLKGSVEKKFASSGSARKVWDFCRDTRCIARGDSPVDRSRSEEELHRGHESPCSCRQATTQ